MNVPKAPSAITDNLDERLAHCLSALVEQGEAALVPMIEANPDLAEELRALWGVARLTRDLAEPGFEQSVNSDSRNLPRSFGSYTLLEELGRGGMGMVYKAIQSQPKRFVAVKMILAGSLADPVESARFQAEARLLARLEGHPNIVPIYEVGEFEGHPYFSMRYIEGTTLARRIAQGPIPAAEAARILAIVAGAIEYAHAQGIVHRDLKPSNILLDAQSVPYVSDFGLAKNVESAAGLTPSRAVLGTPAYLAPEQADGSLALPGPVSDVYSLGAILYEMLTGRRPFQAASPFATIQMVLQQEPPPPHVLNPHVDRELEMICLKCLEKAPRLRYRSAAALAEDLQAFLRGESTLAGPISIRYFITRLLRDTHHAPIMEHWGLLWMWHSLKISSVSLLTNILWWQGIRTHFPYLALWSISLIVWGIFFWSMRRRGGPVMFIERQMAHIWAGGVAGSICMFAVEWILDLPVLTLTPGLAAVGGMVFLGMAGILSGSFYLAAGVLFLTIIPMAYFPAIAPSLFGLATAVCFFIPGFKYWRIRARRESARTAPPTHHSNSPLP